VDRGEDVEIAREVSLDTTDRDLTAIDPSDMVPAGATTDRSASTDATDAGDRGESERPLTITVTQITPVLTDDVADDTPPMDAGESLEMVTDIAVVVTDDAAELMAPDAETTPDADGIDASADLASPDAAAADEVQTPAESPALRAVELEQLPKLDLPVEEQPIDAMAQAYRALDRASLPPADRELLDFRLAVLEQNRQLASVLQGVVAVRRGLQTTAVVRPRDGRAATDYDAVGRLLASAVYNGNSLPLMFRLVNPASGRTIAYVQPDRVNDTRSQLGRVVGIIGPMAYDPVLKLNVIEVREIDAFDPDE
jgi:hypothetical protein